MNEKMISTLILVLALSVGLCAGAECCEGCKTSKTAQASSDPVDAILEKLNTKTQGLKTYEGQIEYKFIQPYIESESLRKGNLYYIKDGMKSRLRINFATLQQDDEKPQKRIEQYLVLDGAAISHRTYKFEGVWLVQINHQIEELKYYQLTEAQEPNKPVDLFELVSRRMPLIGFTRIENLKKQFEITLVEQKTGKQAGFIQLHLKVKPNSSYKDEYVSLDFWIDEKLGLPTKVVAVSTEEDVYEIRFLKPKMNKRIDKKVFEFKIPKGFGEPEIVPLKKENE